MPLGFLRRSSIFGANAVGLLQFAAFVGMIFILTNYLQQILNYSALSAGLAFVPIGVVFLVVSGFLSARLVNRFGVKPILISGMTLQTIGYLLLSRISLQISSDIFLSASLTLVVTPLGISTICFENWLALSGKTLQLRSQNFPVGGNVTTSIVSLPVTANITGIT
jgi:hypothetical protein